MAYETGMDVERIRANIAAREAYKELMSFVDDVLLYKKANKERFLELLAAETAASIGKVLVDDGPTFRMSDKEAEQFEKLTFPYGKFKGEEVGDVDLEYILLLTEGSFTRQLVRYARSQRFIDRQ